MQESLYNRKYYCYNKNNIESSYWQSRLNLRVLVWVLGEGLGCFYFVLTFTVVAYESY